MSRQSPPSLITSTFVALAARQKKGLITFITAGDPAPELTVPLMHAQVAGGADMLELGVPFSDPMAEGPVIQRACERALSFGVSVRDVLAYVREFRRTNTHTPVVLMGYANPIEHMGIDAFITEARAAGVNGTIVVDYPPEECVEFAQKMDSAGLDPIFLLAPTSSIERMKHIAPLGRGFIYYVSLKGVTGAAHIDLHDVERQLAHIKQHITLPIAVGFGIHDASTARAVAQCSDAVVIGSRLIQAMESVPKEEAVSVVQRFVEDIRSALDQSSPIS